MNNNQVAGIELTSGPTRLTSRIFVQNLPDCTREELADHCKEFGQILGSLVEENRGYIQYAKQSSARNAISVLHGSTFQSRVLTVTSASFRTMEEYGFIPPQG
ncbi:uncharacterized protein LOC108049657 [Drosophila rhopaloa]|uniref:Uncharacterized protein LOC108049657 n=1 Tax=Drosophila rhopaloa TaxID=1041015 RepID=A0A6P4F804_DRORH|nr:uncharacterized protein LOC108049657 [Drosophila rhopaloa]